MSAEAVIASDDENIVNSYQTLTWIGNQISFWTENDVYIRIKIDEDEILTFLDEKRKMMQYQQLIKELKCKNQNFYIEWVQETGKYLYFDVLETIEKVENVKFNLSVFKYDVNNANNANNDKYIQPKFDESIPFEKILNGNDIILLSPQRSFELKYTRMGDYYNNNSLYLGPLPSKEFIKQCYIKYLINCCAYSNDKDILQLPNVTEYSFDVAGWTVGKFQQHDNDDNNDNNEQKSDKILYTFKELQLIYLDKKIDLIDKLLKKGNILIHCLAGAHRSPFITGCYQYKYGKLNGKTAKDVYKWLTTKREIVQPLGYDRWMTDYFAFLEKNKQK